MAFFFVDGQRSSGSMASIRGSTRAGRISCPLCSASGFLSGSLFELLIVCVCFSGEHSCKSVGADVQLTCWQDDFRNSTWQGLWIAVVETVSLDLHSHEERNVVAMISDRDCLCAEPIWTRTSTILFLPLQLPAVSALPWTDFMICLQWHEMNLTLLADGPTVWVGWIWWNSHSLTTGWLVFLSNHWHCGILHSGAAKLDQPGYEWKTSVM